MKENVGHTPVQAFWIIQQTSDDMKSTREKVTHFPSLQSSGWKKLKAPYARGFEELRRPSKGSVRPILLKEPGLETSTRLSKLFGRPTGPMEKL